MDSTPYIDRFRLLLQEAFVHGLGDIHPAALLESRLALDARAVLVSGRRWEGKGRLLVCAAGKAAPAMAAAAARILEGRMDRALLVCSQDAPSVPEPFEFLRAEHPVPGQGSLHAAQVLRREAQSLGPGDLLLFLLSGGASSLLAAPLPPLSPQDMQSVYAALLSSGADIVDTNVVRKHVSLLAGGRLARMAYPARIETLAISDVPTNDLSSIGSGPTVPDTSTYALAVGVIERYGLGEGISRTARRFLTEGIRGMRPETPKKGEPCFLSSRAEILCSARTLLEKMALHLALLPRVEIWESDQMGSMDYQAARLLAHAEEARSRGALPCAILAAGEPTLALPAAAQAPESAQGGRAAHFALRFMLEAERKGLSPYVLLSGASDGSDGSLDAAGAICDSALAARSRKMGERPERYLENFDSHSYFRAAGSLLRTGPTNTNVSDVRALILW